MSVFRGGRRLLLLGGRSMALTGCIAVAACATLERGETADIPVQTSPSGAQVNATTGMVCTSPCSIPLGRMDAVVITISKPGYVTQAIVVKGRRIAGTEGKESPMPSVDFLGRIVDTRAHADFEHDQSAISVVLTPQSPRP